MNGYYSSRLSCENDLNAVRCKPSAFYWNFKVLNGKDNIVKTAELLPMTENTWIEGFHVSELYGVVKCIRVVNVYN